MCENIHAKENELNTVFFEEVTYVRFADTGI